MNKTLYPIILTGLLLIAIIAACGLPSIPITPFDTETPVPTVSPTETATLVITPTKLDTPVPATPGFAPFCEPGAASVPTPPQCRLPIAEESSVFCTDKVPYNLLYINKGATIEVLTDRFKCSDAGMKDDRQMVTCTGPMASVYEVRVCDPACAVPTVQVEITQCPDGFNYDTFQGCCSQETQPVPQNCVLLRLETTSCVVDCSEFKKKSSCDNNSYACEWNAETKECQLRR